MKRNIILAAVIAVLPAAAVIAQSLCVDCVSIRVGRPFVVRGPSQNDIDITFNQVKLANGNRRGFSANAQSNFVTGLDPWSMQGPVTTIPTLNSGTADGFSDCGRWLADTKRLVNGQIHGFVHAETGCNYAVNQTRKSLAYATSSDNGVSWSTPQQIITGPDAPWVGHMTGEGDCTVVDGKDSYYYAYCLRASDWRTIVARAPVAAPGPGNWRKWFGNTWSEPGLAGQATPILGASTSSPSSPTDPRMGMGSARWIAAGQIILVGSDPITYPDGVSGFGGVKISFSSNKTNFVTLKEPLWVADQESWTRATGQALDFFFYFSMLSNEDSSNQLGNHFLITHTYINPGEDFDKRYLVFRDVYLTLNSAPMTPQVGVALTRWFNASTNDMRSTVAPVPENFTSFVLEKSLGFLMTKAPTQYASTQLEECSSNWPGHPDNILTFNGTCAPYGYKRLRTAGWVFQSPQPNTVPIYRCFNPALVHHFASNQADCENKGNMEFILGYGLQS